MKRSLPHETKLCKYMGNKGTVPRTQPFGQEFSLQHNHCMTIRSPQKTPNTSPTQETDSFSINLRLSIKFI